jgi:hypothetical protein
METRDRPVRNATTAVGGRAGRDRELTAGGVEGNDRLTTVTGAALIVLLLVLGVTIVQIGQLIWLHLFLGLLVMGPVALKMASTGYRFARYYAHDPVYRREGPPELGLRLLAPGVVLSTVIVFVSGLVLLFDGPAGRATWLTIHKASFILWGVLTGLHVFGHLTHTGDSLRAEVAELGPAEQLPGRGGRGIALAGAIVAGLVLAIVLIPDFAAWTTQLAFAHHHDG